MALSEPKLLFWSGKFPQKSIHFDTLNDKDRLEQASSPPPATPSLCGVPLKYISYVFPLGLSTTFITRSDSFAAWLP
jgi:hypothetical protein